DLRRAGAGVHADSGALRQPPERQPLRGGAVPGLPDPGPHPQRSRPRHPLHRLHPHPRLHHPPLRQRLLGGVAPILTPPRGGVRQWPYGTTRSSGIPFQSSLRPEAECGVAISAASAGTLCSFQSSLRPDAECDPSTAARPFRRPAFLSSLRPEAECDSRWTAPRDVVTETVSILTPPRGGVRRPGATPPAR